MMTITGGAVYVVDHHTEGSTDLDYWFFVSGSNSILSFSHGPFTIAAAKSHREVIYCDPTVTHGGVILNDYGVFSISPYNLRLVGGLGRVQASFMNNYSAGAQPVTSVRLNAMAYGDFESAHALNDWVVSGETLPARSHAVVHSGTSSLKFSGLAGQNNAATMTRPCKSGQMVAVELWASLTGYGVGGNFYGEFAFLDSAGVSLYSGAPLNITANLAMSYFNFGAINPAPAGTASFRLAISFFGVNSGTPFGYIDDVVVNII
jgi:hypothetical protein